MVDFGLYTLTGMSAFFILPGQAHHYIDSDSRTQGWFLALDVGLVPDMFRAVLAGLYMGQTDAGTGQPMRPVLITRDFRKLLIHRYKSCKSPAAYASSLNMSLSYLNEALRKLLKGKGYGGSQVRSQGFWD